MATTRLSVLQDLVTTAQALGIGSSATPQPTHLPAGFDPAAKPQTATEMRAATALYGVHQPGTGSHCLDVGPGTASVGTSTGKEVGTLAVVVGDEDGGMASLEGGDADGGGGRVEGAGAAGCGGLVERVAAYRVAKECQELEAELSQLAAVADVAGWHRLTERKAEVAEANAVLTFLLDNRAPLSDTLRQPCSGPSLPVHVHYHTPLAELLHTAAAAAAGSSGGCGGDVDWLLRFTEGPKKWGQELAPLLDAARGCAQAEKGGAAAMQAFLQWAGATSTW